MSEQIEWLTEEEEEQLKDLQDRKKKQEDLINTVVSAMVTHGFGEYTLEQKVIDEVTKKKKWTKKNVKKAIEIINERLEERTISGTAASDEEMHERLREWSARD